MSLEIYGIVEKTTFYRLGIIPVEVKRDHSELISRASQLKGKRVGLELIENFENVEVPEITIPEIYKNLHENLKSKNEIVFLDDRELYEKCQGLLKRYDSERNVIEKFKLHIEIDYISLCKRNEEIIRKINQNDLDAAFIGGAHAYDFHKKHKDKGRVFLEVPSNLEEVAEKIDRAFLTAIDDQMLDDLLDLLPSLVYRIYDVEELPEKQEFEEEVSKFPAIERLYNLISKGRFEPEIEKKPDYIGSWSLSILDIPLRGFFEVYLDEQLIKDCVGDARFDGKIDEKNARFSKKYFKSFSLFGGPIKEEIYYESLSPIKIGSLRGIAGIYHTEGRIKGRPFILFRYSEEGVQKLLNLSSEDVCKSIF